MTNHHKIIEFSYPCIQALYLATLVITITNTFAEIGTQVSLASQLIASCIVVLPLLLFAFAVFTRNVRGLIWLCFVLCLYFTLSIVDFMSTKGTWVNALEAVLITSLFINITVLLRGRAKLRKQEELDINKQSEHKE